MAPTTAFMVAIAIALGSAMAQEAASSAAHVRDGDLLLNCRIEGHTPEEPGRGDQGGYAFEYQSLFGVTDDERSCTVYRLRNSADKPPTPFRWTQGDAVVVGKGRLPRCAGDACEWLTFVRYFPGGVDAAPSVLSYGLNADAYQDATEAFVGAVGLRDDEAAAAAGATASSVGTEVLGALATVDGEALTVHLIVKSRFEPGPDGDYRLVYEVEDLARTGALGSGAVRVAWGPLEAFGADAAGFDRTTDGVALTVDAAAFALDESLELRVFVRGEEEPVMVVSMPAYLPIDDAASGY
jgi:hypothetical protein